MTIPAQQYAGLARDSYEDHRVGRSDPRKPESVDVGGVQYRVIEHVNNKATGYQGTIYQRADTREIVVAHRGTEFDKELYRDALYADGAMVFNRTNPQAADAIELTRHAQQYAKSEGQRTGHAPEVTVTGHSLGGALAQISAHHFGLKGETFNAYGAASLGYRVPEGGHAMVNHVMAADFVSAASGHYGQVRVYATQQEIDRLQAGGFSNSRLNALMPDTAVGVAARSIDSHKMHNFLEKDANGRADLSVLSDPQARQLAEQNRRMIDEYRSDVRDIRSTTTILSRSPSGLLQDAIDGIRGPLEAGEPARREPSSHSGRERPPPRIDDPRHDGFSLFQDAERGVQTQDTRAGRTSDILSRQLAGALAAEMYVVGGRDRIDSVLMSNDATRAFAIQGRVDDPAQVRVSVDTLAGMNTSLEASTRRIAEHSAQQQTLAQEQSQNLEPQQEARSRAMG